MKITKIESNRRAKLCAQIDGLQPGASVRLKINEATIKYIRCKYARSEPGRYRFETANAGVLITRIFGAESLRRRVGALLNTNADFAFKCLLRNVPGVRNFIASYNSKNGTHFRTKIIPEGLQVFNRAPTLETLRNMVSRLRSSGYSEAILLECFEGIHAPQKTAIETLAEELGI